MANNASYHGSMMIDDVQVGQKLIAVEHGRWSNPIHQEGPWEVVKKTKTRLVLTMIRVVEGAEVLTTVTNRVVVRDGKVTSRVEGRSEFYGGMSLYTEDDAALAEVRATTARSRVHHLAEQAAETAHRRLTKENAEKAITALQAFVDSQTED